MEAMSQLLKKKLIMVCIVGKTLKIIFKEKKNPEYKIAICQPNFSCSDFSHNLPTL